MARIEIGVVLYYLIVVLVLLLFLWFLFFSAFFKRVDKGVRSEWLGGYFITRVFHTKGVTFLLLESRGVFLNGGLRRRRRG
jgi:hypothetical protein